jgi:hypothetical protein
VICGGVFLLGLWNAHAYPPGRGYDAADHIAYADGLVPHGRLPHGVGEYYTPPGFYAVAGTLDWIGRGIGLGEPHRLVLALNVLLLVATTVLVHAIAREAGLGRRGALAAAAFVGFVPVTVKAEAMFHPETLDLFLCTLALLLAARVLRGRRAPLALVAGLGVVLGLAQLVRAFSLWAVASVVLAFAVGRRWRELALVVVVAALIPSPWYVHQRETYGGSPVFNRPTKAKPVWERRPASFYVDPGIPDVVSRPWRPHFLNRALPTTYTELWGDYFGVWSWQGTAPPSSARPPLVRQSLVGLLPTLRAVVGAALFLVRSRRAPERLAVALLPALGILGYLYFTVSYPTPDGDVLKATYMLSTAGAWAVGFGYALERLRGRLRLGALVLVALCLAVELPYLVY